MTIFNTTTQHIFSKAKVAYDSLDNGAIKKLVGKNLPLDICSSYSSYEDKYTMAVHYLDSADKEIFYTSKSFTLSVSHG